MKPIASFTIDHLKLKRGIYVSRKDQTPEGSVITTFDIRMTEPNRQEAITPKQLHSIEHLAATFLRNDPQWKDRILYWGPMGCCTGNYLLVAGDYRSEDVAELMRRTFEFIASYEGQIPGASPKECGNYTFMDLEGARKAARTYLDEVLNVLTEENLNYPE